MRPTMRMATISSVVATGRMMNMRDGFTVPHPRRVRCSILLLCRDRAWAHIGGQHYRRPVTQLVTSIGHDEIAGREAREDGDALTIHGAEGYGSYRDGAVRLHEVDKRSHQTVRCPPMHRSVRHHDLLVQHVGDQLDVDELVGKQEPVLVVEQSAQLDRTGRRIDLVVEGEQLAHRELVAVAAIVGLYR